MKEPIVEAIARRDRVVAFTALAFVVCISAALMQSASDALMRFYRFEPASLAFLGLLFIMWWMMMLAMMLPSAAPAILLYGAIARRSIGGGGRPELRTVIFAAGYAAIWTVFSLAAMGLHVLVAVMMPMTPMMAVTGRIIGGIMLIAAGLYQLTPLKASCLKHCQSPIMFLGHHWKPGLTGAFRVGLHHGLYCLGCCVVLMAILFYGGVMEPLWIGGLAIYILIEKLVPPSWPLHNLSGILLAVWGLLVLLGYA